MKSHWGLGALTVALAVALTACVTSTKAPTTTGPVITGPGLMWVTTEGDQMVSAFTINLSNGAVSKVGNSVAAGVSPSAIAVTPDNKTLFVANAGNANSVPPSPPTINSYTVSSNGGLTALASVTPSCLDHPMGLAVDPNGAYLFVANQGTFGNPASGTVCVLPLSTLSTPVANVSTAVVGAGVSAGPVAIAVDPTGKFLYVANEFAGTVSAFSYDSTGQLTQLGNPLGNSPYTVGANPSALAFSRTVSGTTNRDNFLFVANSGSNTVSIFNACVVLSLTCATAPASVPTGLLSPATPVGSIGAGSGPAGFMVDPAFDFVYVLERSSSQISEYTYSPATGGLGALSSTASVSGSPFAAGITADGNWVFVSNNSGSNLSAFAVATTGILSPATTPSIALSGQPSALLVK